ncbi:hypothetical protein HDU77_005176 [Chytriomyces hyalinus]|nr:hypothetical protein HDU77_005176 [Chytriomyces hyalinus]
MRDTDTRIETSATRTHQAARHPSSSNHRRSKRKRAVDFSAACPSEMHNEVQALSCSSASFKTESHDKLSDTSSYTPTLKKSSDTNASFLGLYPYSDAGGLDALLPAMHPANLYDPFLFGQDYLCGGGSNDGWIAQSGFSSFDGLFPPAADEVFRRDWKCSQDAFEDSVAESYLVFSSPSKPQSHVDGEADLCFEDENTASLTFPDTSVLLQVMDRECRDGNFCDAAALSQDTDDDCTPPTTEPCSRIISPLMFMHTTHTGRRDDACMSPPPAAGHGSSIHEAAQQQQQQQQQASWPLAKKAVAKPYENLDDILPYIPWQELDVYRGSLPSMIPSKLANVPKQIVEEERPVVAPKCTEVETRGDNINNTEKPSKHRKKAGRKSISFNYEDFGDAIVICSVCQKPYGSQNGLRCCAPQEIHSEPEAKELDEDALFEELEKDDDHLLADMRERRMAELRAEMMQAQEEASSSFGSYENILSEKEVLLITTSTDKCVVHFYHKEFRRCQIMDRHLGTLARKHGKTRFLKIDVEVCPFLVEKLQIKVLPCVIPFINGVSVDRLVGFEELGESDAFQTAILEKRLAETKVLSMGEFETAAVRKTIFGFAEKKNDDDDEDSDY